MDLEVTATVKESGRVVELAGPWGRERVGVAVRHIDNGRCRYYVAGPAYLETYLLPNGAADVWVPEDPDALMSLPDPTIG